MEVSKLILYEMYDCKDSNGVWFQVKILYKMGKQARVHYIGFPSGFDEDVDGSRITKLYTYTANWREEIIKQEGNQVDFFLDDLASCCD
jgi:hypothetical protein